MKLLAGFEIDMRERMNGWRLLTDSEDQDEQFEAKPAELFKPGETYVSGQTLLPRANEIGSCTGQRHAESLRREGSRIFAECPKDVFLFPDTLWENQSGAVFVPAMRLFAGLNCLFFHPLDVNFEKRWRYRLIVARLTMSL